MLPKSRTLSRGFSDSSVVLPVSESMPSYQDGDRKLPGVATSGSKKGLVLEEHPLCNYMTLSSARSWRGLEAVIDVLLPVSDSHTECACVPAVHPHP